MRFIRKNAVLICAYFLSLPAAFFYIWAKFLGNSTEVNGMILNKGVLFHPMDVILGCGMLAVLLLTPLFVLLCAVLTAIRGR